MKIYELGLVVNDQEPLWREDFVYKHNQIYKIDGKAPPVNYATHILNSHSCTHVEFPSHVIKNGKTSSDFILSSDYYTGECCIVRLRGNNFKCVGNDTYLWEVSLEELRTEIDDISCDKFFITVDDYPTCHIEGLHDPSYVLILSEEAARYLVDIKKIKAYGTSWKSTDFKPGSMERPVHKIIFESAIIYELLDLRDVPAGLYQLVATFNKIKGASEIPLNPVLIK